jgi:hypothetical protein
MSVLNEWNKAPAHYKFEEIGFPHLVKVGEYSFSSECGGIKFSHHLYLGGKI